MCEDIRNQLKDDIDCKVAEFDAHQTKRLEEIKVLVNKYKSGMDVKLLQLDQFATKFDVGLLREELKTKIKETLVINFED